jgi:hypothetical protein
VRGLRLIRQVCRSPCFQGVINNLAMKRCLSSGNVSANGSFVPVTNNKKARKHRQKNQYSASQPLADDHSEPIASQMDIQAVIDSVAHVNYTESTLDHSRPITSDKTACQQIAELRSTVKILSDQVSFLLSYVGIIDTVSSSVAIQESEPNYRQTQSKATYSRIVQQNAPTLQQSIKEAVITAVYVDQTKKMGQAANVVISGLPLDQLSSDKISVTKLLSAELNLHVDVVKCKRLGKAVSGKTQAIVVTLHSVAEADLIMAKAKHLRRSAVSSVRELVYINRHLTAAESRAAYELRCQRRQSAQKQSSRRVDSTEGLSSTGPGTPSVQLSSLSLPSVSASQLPPAGSPSGPRALTSPKKQGRETEIQQQNSGGVPDATASLTTDSITSKSPGAGHSSLSAKVPEFQPAVPLLKPDNLPSSNQSQQSHNKI